MYFEKLDYNKIPQLSKKMKTFFSYNPDINKTAYLNWRTNWRCSIDSKMIVIADGYFQTAHFLAEKCLEDNIDKKADIWIFPILFNVIHGVELHLKVMNMRLNDLLGTGSVQIEGGHDISQLCCVSLKRIEELKKRDASRTNNEIYTAVKLIYGFIKNIYANTNDMTFVRYPIQKDKTEQFYINEEENVVVDMVLLKEQMEYVIALTEFINEMLEDSMDNRNNID